MATNAQIIVQSTNKAVKKANITGKLNLKKVLLFTIFKKYIDFAENEGAFVSQRKDLISKAYTLKNMYPDIICNYKTVLPKASVSQTGEASQANVSIVKVNADNFTVSEIILEPLFGSGTEYYTYRFKKSDFQAVYSDNNDDKFYSIIIYRDSLNGGGLKYNRSAISGETYGESAVPIEIQYNDIEKWSFYTDSTSIYSHAILFRIIDRVQGKDYASNQYTMTVNRIAGGNQPATIGDITETINNRAVVPITLAMVTSSLAPPYNDPEGDLIDAIRIVEISTANKGIITLSGVIINEGDVFTREQIESNALVYSAPNYDDIWADSFRFQARDEGSGIWVD
jgi:hypothetical protein